MRTIKFKAKRIDNGEWIEGDLVHEIRPIAEDLYLAIKNGITYEVDPETVCQFTGLYDKYGKEIWEGDILTGEPVKGYVIEQKVEWQNDVAGFSIRSENTRFYAVIGNIHDKEAT